MFFVRSYGASRIISLVMQTTSRIGERLRYAQRAESEKIITTSYFGGM